VAATEAGRQLTEGHRLVQARLSVASISRLLDTWSLLDPTSIDTTTARWLAQALAVVAQQRAISAEVARAYQRQFRAIELDEPLDALPIPPPPPLPVEAASTSLLTQGPVKLKELMGTGRPLTELTELTARSMASAGTRHVLNGGRELVMAAADADPAASGVRRITSPGCCSFCALLAARSYDGLSAEFFKVHDNCHCVPETAYTTGAQDATRQAREFAALYSESTADVGGGSKAKQNAFRRALEAQRST
jgi:hypothetical protein